MIAEILNGVLYPFRAHAFGQMKNLDVVKFLFLVFVLFVHTDSGCREISLLGVCTFCTH